MAYDYDPPDKFGYKDTLPENHPEKVVTGVEFDDEFLKIEAEMTYLQTEIDGLTSAGGVGEAPKDGETYGRNMATWVPVADKAHSHEISNIDGLPEFIADHTHEIADIDDLQDQLDTINNALSGITSNLVFGGSYDLENDIVLRSTKEDEGLMEGQPLPADGVIVDTFMILTSGGTMKGETLARGDWIVADGAGIWIPIPYSIAQGIDWGNIQGMPDFDALYAPIDHDHPEYLEDAPLDGEQYTRQSGSWAVVSPVPGPEGPTGPGGSKGDKGDGWTGGSYNPSNGVVTFTSDDGLGFVTGDLRGGPGPEGPEGPEGPSVWTKTGNDIYYNTGNVGIGTISPSRQFTMEDADAVLFSMKSTGEQSCQILFGDSASDTSGKVLYDNNGDYMTLHTGGAERVRLNSGELTVSGPKLNVDVGPPTGGVDKLFIEAGADTRNLNLFWDDSQSTVGFATPNAHEITFHIGGYNNEKARVTSDGVVWAGGHGRKGYGGVSFSNASDGKPWMVPTDDTGSGTNGQMHLGDASYKFRNGYFSGTVTAGSFVGDGSGLTGISSGGASTWDELTGKPSTFPPSAHGHSYSEISGAPAIPTKTSQLTNDSGYITSASVPTKTSQLTNDSGFVDSSALSAYATQSWVNSQGFAKGDFVPKSGNTTISGTLTATDFVATSDERLKDNISPMPIGLIDDIKPVMWDWKDGSGKSAGVVAQQLQAIGLDDYVTENSDGQLGVNYQALTAILLAEVISLKAEVESLK